MSQPSSYSNPSAKPPTKRSRGPAKVSGFAIASIVLGGLSLVFSCLTGIVGLILGIVALAQINGSKGAKKGTGLAITGMALSILLSLILPVAMLLPAIASVRVAAQRTATHNNLRQIVLAQLNYESAHQRFPNNAGGLSWRVHILPYIEYGHLYEQFHLDEPWDSPHNLALLDQMPAVFESIGAEQLELGKTRYLRPIGNGAAPMPGTPEDLESFGFGDIHDGSSNTLAVVEVADSRAVNWTEPADFEFDPNDPRAGLGNIKSRLSTFVGATYDGASHNIDSDLDSNSIGALMTLQGGEAVAF